MRDASLLETEPEPEEDACEGAEEAKVLTDQRERRTRPLPS